MADDQLNTNLERILTGLRSELDGSLRKAVEEIVRGLSLERDRAVAAATADVRRQAQDQLGQLREAARRQSEEVRAAAEAQVAELRGMLDDLRRTAQQQIEAARTKLDAEIATVRAKAETDSEEARRSAESRVQEAESRIQEAESRVQEAQSRIQEIERGAAERVAGLEADLASVRLELEGQREAIEAERERAEHARQTVLLDLEAERERAEQARQAASRFEHEIEHERAERAREVAARPPAGRDARQLVEATRSLDEARSLREVFDRLVDHAARDSERCALLYVKGERLQGWRLTGFDQRASSERVEVALSDTGVVGDAVRERRTVSHLREADPALPAFAGVEERQAAAFPITVADVVVAVLYADVAAAPDGDAGWIALLEVVARHASRVLETTTVHHATGLAGAPSLARPSQPPPGQPSGRQGMQ